MSFFSNYSAAAEGQRQGLADFENFLTTRNRLDEFYRQRAVEAGLRPPPAPTSGPLFNAKPGDSGIPLFVPKPGATQPPVIAVPRNTSGYIEFTPLAPAAPAPAPAAPTTNQTVVTEGKSDRADITLGTSGAPGITQVTPVAPADTPGGRIIQDVGKSWEELNATYDFNKMIEGVRSNFKSGAYGDYYWLGNSLSYLWNTDAETAAMNRISEARAWWDTEGKVKEFFRQRPELLQEATKDPVGFYERNIKNAQTVNTEAKGDLGTVVPQPKAGLDTTTVAPQPTDGTYLTDNKGRTAPQPPGPQQPAQQPAEQPAAGVRVRVSTDTINSALNAAAAQLGLDPADLAAVISYETGGTFNPDQMGGKGGKHMGLIQFGPEEQKTYGITPGMSFEAQLKKVVQFALDRGFKPGQMGIADFYSTVNAGSPGKMKASDVAAGGDAKNPTVADKVQEILTVHRDAAIARLGMDDIPAALREYATKPLGEYDMDSRRILNERDITIKRQEAEYAQMQTQFEQLMFKREELVRRVNIGGAVGKQAYDDLIALDKEINDFRLSAQNKEADYQTTLMGTEYKLLETQGRMALIEAANGNTSRLAQVWSVMRGSGPGSIEIVPQSDGSYIVAVAGFQPAVVSKDQLLRSFYRDFSAVKDQELQNAEAARQSKVFEATLEIAKNANKEQWAAWREAVAKQFGLPNVSDLGDRKFVVYSDGSIYEYNPEPEPNAEGVTPQKLTQIAGPTVGLSQPNMPTMP